MKKIYTKFKNICTNRIVGKISGYYGYYGAGNMWSRFFSTFSNYILRNFSLNKAIQPKVYVASIFGIVLTIASCAVGGVIAVASVAAWWSEEPVDNQENKTSFEEMSDRQKRYDEQQIELEKSYQIWLAKKKPSDGSSGGSTDGSTDGSETTQHLATITKMAEDLSYDMNVINTQYNNLFSQYDKNVQRSKYHGIKDETEIRKQCIDAFFEQANINPESEKAKNISNMVNHIHDLAKTEKVSFKVATEKFLSISKEEFERNKPKKRS